MFSLSFLARLHMSNFSQLRYYMQLSLCFLLLLVSVGLAEAQTNTPTPTPTSTPVPYDWCYKFDFTASNGGWVTYAHFSLTGGVWNSGTGWTASASNIASSSQANMISIKYTLPAGNYNLREVTIHHDYTKGHYQIGSSSNDGDGNVFILDENNGGTNMETLLWQESLLIDFAGTNKSYYKYLGNTSTNTALRLAMYASYDNNGALTTDGVWVLHDIEFRGLSTSPFPASNCGSFAPTPTPTPTQTATATATGTPPVGENSLCPGSLVDPSTVSGAYQMQCQPCLAAYSTPDGTSTVTPTPNGFQTSTPPPSVATYVPASTQPAVTPTPSIETCDFSVDCDFVSVDEGSVGVLGVDDVDFAIGADFYRAVRLAFIMPLNESGLGLLSTIEIEVLLSQYSSPDVITQYISQTGITLAIENEDASDGNITITKTVNDNTSDGTAYYVVVTIIADKQAIEANLIGSVTVSQVTLTHGQMDTGSAFDEQTVICYLPTDYAATSAFEVSLGGFLYTTCHTIVPYVDLQIITDVLESFGWDVVGFYIPQIEVCIDWYVLPSITFLGLLVPLTFVINVILLRQFIAWVLKF